MERASPPNPHAVSLLPLPPTLAQELQQRRALATPQDTARGMFFSGVLETVRQLGGTAREQECRRLLTEKRFLDFFSYPISEFLPLAFRAAHMLASICGDFDEAHRRMGQQATHDFLASVAGRTLLILSRDDPQALLSQLHSAFRLAVSYGERTMTWTGPKNGRFIMKRDFMPPAYHEGVLQAVLEAVGARNVEVRGQVTGVLDAEYEMSWT